QKGHGITPPERVAGCEKLTGANEFSGRVIDQIAEKSSLVDPHVRRVAASVVRVPIQRLVTEGQCKSGELEIRERVVRGAGRRAETVEANHPRFGLGPSLVEVELVEGRRSDRRVEHDRAQV